MGAMDVKDTRHELARRIRERRNELGLTQKDLRPLGGPSDETVRQWERGNIVGAPRAKTLIGLDLALSWKPGTSSCILAGGPTQGQEEVAAAVSTTLTTQWHAVPDSVITELVDALDTLALRDHLSEISDPQTTELITKAHSLASMLTKAAQVAPAVVRSAQQVVPAS